MFGLISVTRAASNLASDATCALCSHRRATKVLALRVGGHAGQLPDDSVHGPGCELSRFRPGMAAVAMSVTGWPERRNTAEFASATQRDASSGSP